MQGLSSTPTVRLERKLGDLPEEAMLKIKQALVFCLDLVVEVEEQNLTVEDES